MSKQDTPLPNAYSHTPNLIPPYVLDTVSKAHLKEELVNSNTNQEGSEYNDIYTNHLNNSWKNFIGSVKQPNLYPARKYDQLINDTYDYSGSWQGDYKLKAALLDSDEELTYQEEKSYFGNNGVSTTDSENSKSKFKSRAGYWLTSQKRKDLIPSIKRMLMQNPLVPVFFRILIILFSGCALGMAGTIYQYSHREYRDSSVDQQPSTMMAIVVNTCAIIYCFYIGYDELFGKPIGLKHPLEKVNFILLDTVFMIFSSANVSLAFNTLLDDRWVCKPSPLRDEAQSQNYPVVHSICRRQRALASFLLIIIVLWILTFTITVARVIDRVTVKNK